MNEWTLAISNSLGKELSCFCNRSASSLHLIPQRINQLSRVRRPAYRWHVCQFNDVRLSDNNHSMMPTTPSVSGFHIWAMRNCVRTPRFAGSHTTDELRVWCVAVIGRRINTALIRWWRTDAHLSIEPMCSLARERFIFSRVHASQTNAISVLSSTYAFFHTWTKNDERYMR